MPKVEWTYQKPLDNYPGVHENELNLFRVNLSELFEKLDDTEIPYLSVEEKIKISKFKFKKDKIRFGIGRFILKCLLSQYVEQSPETIDFSTGEYGKPFLEKNKDYTFNLSHSGDLLLIGIGQKFEVGVDVEVYKRDIDHLSLAKSVFSLSEQKALRSSSDDKVIDGFYNCWSLKESFIKALGMGLSLPLDQFSMDLFSLDNTSCLRDVQWDNALIKQWQSHVFKVDDDYSAAFTCDRSIDEINYIDITFNIEHQLNLNTKSRSTV